MHEHTGNTLHIPGAWFHTFPLIDSFMAVNVQRSAAMHDNKVREEDRKLADMDVNKTRSKIFKKLDLQMFYEEAHSMFVIGFKDTLNVFR